jgi:hypothetical protein
MDKPGVSAVALAACQKGLVLGSGRGDFALWIKDDDPAKLFEKRSGDEEKYELVFLAGWTSERVRRAGVAAIDITRNDEVMAVAFKDNDIATFPLGKIVPVVNEGIESMRRNLRNLERKARFEYVFGGSHYGEVLAMDVCVQRPLLVTACADQTIRVWNYMSLRCELVRAFATETEIQSGVLQNPLLSVSFHPTGYYLAAGFIDKMRVFHLLHDRLKVFHEC